MRMLIVWASRIISVCDRGSQWWRRDVQSDVYAPTVWSIAPHHYKVTIRFSSSADGLLARRMRGTGLTDGLTNGGARKRCTSAWWRQKAKLGTFLGDRRLPWNVDRSELSTASEAIGSRSGGSGRTSTAPASDKSDITEKDLHLYPLWLLEPINSLHIYS